jgi:iron-sulfur cluster assembly accessory protein
MATETQSHVHGAASGAVLLLTDQAVQQVKTILARENLEGYGLRVAVTTSGCSGYSYQMDFQKEERPGDMVLEADGFRVYLDRTSVPYLAGTVIDYVSGLQGAGFKFNNPNVKGTCGCGTSFST